MPVQTTNCTYFILGNVQCVGQHARTTEHARRAHCVHMLHCTSGRQQNRGTDRLALALTSTHRYSTALSHAVKPSIRSAPDYFTTMPTASYMCSHAKISYLNHPTYDRRRRRPLSRAAVAGFGDTIRAIFDFESWAPRSSRTWRLRPVPTEAQIKADTTETVDVDLLEDFQRRKSELGTLEISLADTTGDDRDFFRSLNTRLTELNNQELPNAAADDIFSPDTPLTGSVLRQLVYSKYGRYYDLSIVRRNIPGKVLVRLNVMWQHQGQVSFPMSHREFAEKMEVIAYHIRAWQQEEIVRKFFSEPPRSSRGLPGRPVPGSAVSIKLDLNDEQVAEWFNM